MRPPENDPSHFAALKVAGTYGVVGVVWILLSDRLVNSITSSPAHRAFLQTMKGWFFIGTSALLIYALVFVSHRRHSKTRDNLETTLQQAGIVHRILRHNLRNISNIIEGHVAFLESDPEDPSRVVPVLRQQTDRLVDLSRKSRYLRAFLTVEETDTDEFDLAALVRTRAATARETSPHATIRVTAPETAPVHAHKYLGEAVSELVENAITHNPAETPTVWITVGAASHAVTLTVEDDGPGIPDLERTVIDREYETPMEHSQGLGLWLVNFTVQESDGSLSIDDREDGGTSVRITLPRPR